MQAALHAVHSSRHEPSEKPLPESAVEMRRAEEAIALRADSTVNGIEDCAAFIAASELRGAIEERHAGQDVLTEGDIVLQS